MFSSTIENGAECNFIRRYCGMTGPEQPSANLNRFARPRFAACESAASVLQTSEVMIHRRQIRRRTGGTVHSQKTSIDFFGPLELSDFFTMDCVVVVGNAGLHAVFAVFSDGDL